MTKSGDNDRKAGNNSARCYSSTLRERVITLRVVTVSSSLRERDNSARRYCPSLRAGNNSARRYCTFSLPWRTTLVYYPGVLPTTLYNTLHHPGYTLVYTTTDVYHTGAHGHARAACMTSWAQHGERPGRRAILTKVTKSVKKSDSNSARRYCAK